MRANSNFSPLFRSTIGFDRVFDLLEHAGRDQTFEYWPPYDIVRTSDDSYRITMVVAGFSENELTINHQPNLLVVSGSKTEEGNGSYLHRGIVGSPFERRFELADHVKVTNATLEHGLLTISLTREVPEEMKPRRIQIKSGEVRPKTIEGSKSAA